MLNSISQDETGKAIKPVKTKEEAMISENKKEILFIIWENNIEDGFFLLEEETYEQWKKDYKLEGVEI